MQIRRCIICNQEVPSGEAILKETPEGEMTFCKVHGEWKMRGISLEESQRRHISEMVKDKGQSNCPSTLVEYTGISSEQMIRLLTGKPITRKTMERIRFWLSIPVKSKLVWE